MHRFDLIVIGQGVAGMTAAREAAQGGMRVAMFEGSLFGGLITNINALDPAPDPAATMGADFAAMLLESSIGAGAKNMPHHVTAIERTAQGLRVRTDEGEYEAGHVVIATGARFRPLDIPGEEAFTGHGVSNCADCDGPLHRKNEVVVAGGGDSALQEALVLAEHCARVHIVHHGSTLAGRADLVARVAAQANVATIADAEIERIDGGKIVERVIIRRRGDNSRIELPCKGVFAYIGLVPNTEFLSGEFERDARGHLLVDATLETPIPGVFAAGAVRAGFSGTLDDAIRDGTAVARSVATRAAG